MIIKQNEEKAHKGRRVVARPSVRVRPCAICGDGFMNNYVVNCTPLAASGNQKLKARLHKYYVDD